MRCIENLYIIVQSIVFFMIACYILGASVGSGDSKLLLLNQVLSTPIEVPAPPVPSSSPSPPAGEVGELVDISVKPPDVSLENEEGGMTTPDSGSRQRRGSSKNNASIMSSVLLSNLIKSELPQLTVTPLRDLMADNTRTQRKNVVEVMERMRVSDIKLEAKEATELLKYAVVNLMDMREDGVEGESDDGTVVLQEEVEFENAMLSIIDILVVEFGADLDTLDRDGNNLLTFLHQSVTPDMHMSSRLVPTLLRLGMNILTVKEKREDEDNEGTINHTDSVFQTVVLEIHPLFVSLTAAEKDQLIAHFSSVSSVDLNQSQKFTYFALLVVIGRASLASLVMTSVRDVLTHEVASALVKVCSFDSDSMEDPLETFELLDLHGAKF